MQMFCVGMTDNYTMALPLQVLPLLAADLTIKVTYVGIQRLKPYKLLGNSYYALKATA